MLTPDEEAILLEQQLEREYSPLAAPRKKLVIPSVSTPPVEIQRTTELVVNGKKVTIVHVGDIKVHVDD